MKPVVAIVGRPNVGKSALFNKIFGRRKAITKDEIGVTRDVNYAECTEAGRDFTLVDTGGFEPEATSAIMVQVREQAELAIEEADLIVLLMDGREGPTPDDKEIVEVLRRTKKDVIFVVNKIDTGALQALSADFYSLGLDLVMPVSAEHGLGVSELIEEILSRLSTPAEPVESDEGMVRVAIVGRPNAGKSSLLNKLIGKERAVVSAVPGTTRDSVDTVFERDGKKYFFIDTAGIRKKNKISRRLEKYSVMEAIKSLENCDVALLVIDGIEGFSAQDEKIAGLIEDRGVGSAVVVNKWDLVTKETVTSIRYAERIREHAPFIAFAPVLFISALTGQRTDKVFDTIDSLYEQSRKKVKTSVLNDLLKTITRRHTPPVYRGRNVKFYYITQVGTSPQRFAVFMNIPEGVPKAYRRYMINRFRDALDFKEVPIRLTFRRRH
ncbi:MAG: ribosome biogenesis GTPase Der [Deltaproteobacteria bacterium]|nr:ribosome biogenesis GTPase Der [Deltaproteobacteria bacterium]